MRSTAATLIWLVAGVTGAVAQDLPLQLVRTIPLPGGRIDHLAIDRGWQRLYIAELGNDTLGVVDLARGQQVRMIGGLSEPQGVAYLPDPDRVVVANGGTGTVDIFDGGSLDHLGTIDLSGDADNLRYDPARRIVYVGYGDGALGALGMDATGPRQLGDVRLAAHPEAFQLEENGPRIFVNVPGAGHVAVVDRNQGKVVETWPVISGRGNFPMALDEANNRLFVAARRPAKLIMMDTTTGKELANISVCGDADDLFYDAQRQRIYVACGDGQIEALRASRGAELSALAGIRTA